MLEKKSTALLKGVENRDEQAFAHLFDKEAPLVAARLRVRGAGSGDVEDILQETFLTVWEKAGSYRGEGPAAWIWTIARNKWVSRIRAQSRTGFYRSNERALVDFDDPGMKIGD